MSWEDEIKEERNKGINCLLSQSQHRTINTRYLGLTLEYCCVCGEATGNAGKGEDSNYRENGEGPFCWECFPEKEV